MSLDWSSDLGRAARAAEIPDCGCKPKILHDPGCPYAHLDEASPCDCRFAFKGGACFHVRAHVPLLAPDPSRGETEPRPLTFEELGTLLEGFDPDGYREPPLPRQDAAPRDAEDLVALRVARHAQGEGLRHPWDVLPGSLDGVGIQARSGLKQDGIRTPRLTQLERHLLSRLESRVRPAMLLWPWHRAGRDQLPPAARALAEIRDRQLYRDQATTFRQYAVEVWSFLPCDLEVIFASVEGMAQQDRRRTA